MKNGNTKKETMNYIKVIKPPHLSGKIKELEWENRIRETLTRIGTLVKHAKLKQYTTKRDVLVQVCQLSKKSGNNHGIHLLNESPTSSDFQQRDTIAILLEEWSMVEITSEGMDAIEEHSGDTMSLPVGQLLRKCKLKTIKFQHKDKYVLLTNNQLTEQRYRKNET